MLIVDNCIISEDIAECCFCCDLSRCKGQCCIDGDAGAPLDADEIPILRHILPTLTPYLSPAGLQAIREQGVSVVDADEEPTTPLVNNRECAYLTYGDDGIALCAIEKAYFDHKISFQKPISCHLYPIRLDNFGEFIALNYHRWDICRCAVNRGLPLYRYLREPLIRRFGTRWYDELCQQCDLWLHQHGR